jgi:hypothetical protein
VLRAPATAEPLALAGPAAQNGEVGHPLSRPSSLALPAAATSSAAPGGGEPQKRPRGRPPKKTRPDEPGPM